jgi:hypothetical protein
MRERGKSAVRRLVTPLVKLIACRGENLVDGFEIEHTYYLFTEVLTTFTTSLPSLITPVRYAGRPAASRLSGTSRIKLSRGTFTAAFFIQCLDAIDCRTLV